MIQFGNFYINVDNIEYVSYVSQDWEKLKDDTWKEYFCYYVFFVSGKSVKSPIFVEREGAEEDRLDLIKTIRIARQLNK